MNMLLEQFDSIERFMDAGGVVLWPIFITALLLWTLILERYWYHYKVFPMLMDDLQRIWHGRHDGDSWVGRSILDMQLSELSARLNRSVNLIHTLIALCPLLGLLGTVTGMIHVFDVMAVTGTGNPREMASGVSMATIPTMAGMVVALSGMYFASRLKQESMAKSRIARDKIRNIAHQEAL